MPSSTILILDADVVAAEGIANTLRGVGYDVTRMPGADEAIRRAGEFALLIIDKIAPGRSAVDVCRTIRGTPSLAAIPVLCISQADDVEERVRFLEAGADDVMARPFDSRELEARVEALLIRFQRSRDLAPVLGIPGLVSTRHLIACFSPKGGVGTTTIATNVATLFAGRRPERVLIIDLDSQFGQIATHLDVKPHHTIAEIARDEQALREPELLRTYTLRHATGLHVIAAPSTPDGGRLMTATQVDLLLTTARATYDMVVVDAGSELDERALTILERAEGVILPVIPEIGGLKALHTLLEYLAEVSAVRAKATFVLNHIFARDVLTMKQVEHSIASPVEVELPYDPGLYLKAVNEGIPVVLGAPRSAPAERFVRLATLVAGGADTEDGLRDDRRSGRRGLLARHT